MSLDFTDDQARGFTVDEAKQVFCIPTDDWSDHHSDIKGLMIVYCYAFNRPFDIYDEFKMNENEANALVCELIRNRVRIPRNWDKIDLYALLALLESIDLVQEAAEIYELVEYD